MNECAIRLHCRCLRADAYVQEGLYAEALRLLDAALQSDPECVKALALRGRTLALLGRPAAAAAELERVLSLDPVHIEARLQLSAVLIQLGRSVEAEMHRRSAQRAALLPDLLSLRGVAKTSR